MKKKVAMPIICILALWAIVATIGWIVNHSLADEFYDSARMHQAAAIERRESIERITESNLALVEASELQDAIIENLSRQMDYTEQQLLISQTNAYELNEMLSSSIKRIDELEELVTQLESQLASADNVQVTVQPTPTPTPAPVHTGGVNAETFALLRNGMSIAEVQDIIRVTPTSETTTKLHGTTTTMIMWMGSGMRSITVMFTNGRATSISQMGL